MVVRLRGRAVMVPVVILLLLFLTFAATAFTPVNCRDLFLYTDIRSILPYLSRSRLCDSKGGLFEFFLDCKRHILTLYGRHILTFDGSQCDLRHLLSASRAGPVY
jgi:hypothetical protein